MEGLEDGGGGGGETKKEQVGGDGAGLNSRCDGRTQFWNWWPERAGFQR